MTNGNEDRQFIFNANVKKTQRSTLGVFVKTPFTCKKINRSGQRKVVKTTYK